MSRLKRSAFESSRHFGHSAITGLLIRRRDGNSGNACRYSGITWSGLRVAKCRKSKGVCSVRRFVKFVVVADVVQRTAQDNRTLARNATDLNAAVPLNTAMMLCDGWRSPARTELIRQCAGNFSSINNAHALTLISLQEHENLEQT